MGWEKLKKVFFFGGCLVGVGVDFIGQRDWASIGFVWLGHIWCWVEFGIGYMVVLVIGRSLAVVADG